MKQLMLIVSVWLITICPLHLFAGDYERAWTALLQNDQKKAISLFQKAVKSNDNKDNAVAMLVMLEAYRGTNYFNKYPAPFEQLTDMDPYIYALWFHDAMLGDYGKKTGKQLAALDHIINDPSHHGSVKAAGYYFKGLTQEMSQNKSEALLWFKKMQALDKWQFVGPFDNINGSGFNKEYGPLNEPSSPKGFLSSNNTLVNWFTPSEMTNQGWVFAMPYLTESNAIGYAQTFVSSDEDKEAILCIGGYGSLKVWVNDKLLLAHQEPDKTELDAYQLKCHLNKGYNRILVQIGYTNEVSAPNYIVRFTNNNYGTLEGVSCTASLQPYKKDISASAPVELTHFAEKYFLEKIKQSPKDIANVFLLSKVYLRNQQREKAKKLMNDYFRKYPDNPFIINFYADCLSPQFESTQISEIVEKVKLLDADNYYVLSINEAKLEEEKKYDEALVLIDKMVAINGNTLLTDLKRVGLLVQISKVDSAINMVKTLYEKYKDNPTIVNIMAQLYKNVLRDPELHMKVVEDFVKTNSDFTIAKALADEYLEKNETAKGINILRNFIVASPYEPSAYQPLVQYFYGRQQYDSAIFYLKKVAAISPYNHTTLGDIANCYLQKNDKTNALNYYKQGLSYYANGYEYRQRIRELENKPDLYKYFPQTNFYDAIKHAFKKPYDTAHSTYYISEERNIIVYSEGASEVVYSAALKINNKDGINAWKEHSIPYNSYYQRVQILKSEVVKANGARIPAETSGNEIVYTKLEAGDAIYFSYKLTSYSTGRLAKEFWDKFYFNSSTPAKEVKYNVMIANDLPLYYKLLNDDVTKPKESKKENFRIYSWVMNDLTAVRDESYMPKLADIGKVLHVSTVKSWDLIAEWYSDITRMQSREDFELNQAYSTIFPNGVNGLSEIQKAQKIYEFIEDNIAYSSVSFRQSAYVPQRAGKTLQTRLGDCKDMSTLFLSFARKAGLDANLVLVSTRDNGFNSIVLPSMEFNHCIIRYKDGNEYKYLELTDSQLPFATITNSLSNSQVLDIPYDFKPGETIKSFPCQNRQKVGYVRNVKMMVTNNSDLAVKTVLKSTGDLARDMRANYEHKTQEESKDAIQEQLSGAFKNQVVLNKFDFQDLNNLKDTVVQELDFTVKNDVISVGDMNMLKPVMIEIVATANIFTAEKRVYPFEYSDYETADNYKTVVEVELPAGKSFEQIPMDVKGDFMHMRYSLVYRKPAPNKLVIERVFDTDRTKRLSPMDFEKMENFFSQIITAEQKYISFK
jgi:predicted Zn-dependent protease/transglutaminase-like putative cysteine protease